jgi:hypothetical protein
VEASKVAFSLHWLVLDLAAAVVTASLGGDYNVDPFGLRSWGGHLIEGLGAFLGVVWV